MRIAATMADNITGRGLRGRLALGLVRVAHGLFTFAIAAVLLAIPAGLVLLLWHWLIG